jgi:hypothetical protein
MRIAPNPLPVRVASAKTIVVGEVTAIEDKMVSARAFPGAQDKQEYKIAVIKVSDPILGAKGLTHVRVGFLPPAAPLPAPGPGLVRPGFRRVPGVTLQVGQEACFLLAPHFEAPFEMVQGWDGVLNKKDGDLYDKQITVIKRCAKLLEHPMDGLKSRNADDRLTTAAMLIGRYRTAQFFGPGAPKQEPIGAEESKLILLALADGDWTKNDFQQVSPARSFYMLGVTEKDGLRFPVGGVRTMDDQARIIKAWLKQHAGTYRIQRFVVEKPKPADE